jgi:hypothetical protein
MSADLWPKDIGDSKLTPPLKILREQAGFLTENTGGLIVAEVSTEVVSNEMIHNKFVLIVPKLDDYRYELFEVRHQVSFYPLDVLPRSGHNLPNAMEVPNEKKFVEALGSLFGSPEIKRLVHSLVAQASV